MFDAVVKTSTNLNSDPVDMLLNCLKLGISTGLYGLELTNLLNDVMLGEPAIRQAKVGFKIVDEDYINIMITGHQHSIFSYIQDRLLDDDIVQKAKKAEQRDLGLLDVLVLDRIFNFVENIIKKFFQDMLETILQVKHLLQLVE